MSGWIVDTNVLSELRKPRCHPAVRAWQAAQPLQSLFISCVSLAEIRFGIEKLDLSDAFRRTLEDWLAGDLRPSMAGRVLDVDEAVVLVWKRLVAAGKARNYTYSQPDLFIAATALVHGLGIATRNVVDFAAAGVPVLNPWDHAP